MRSTAAIHVCVSLQGIPRDLRCQVWQMLTGAAHDPQLAEAYRLLISKVHTQSTQCSSNAEESTVARFRIQNTH